MTKEIPESGSSEQLRPRFNKSVLSPVKQRKDLINQIIDEIEMLFRSLVSRRPRGMTQKYGTLNNNLNNLDILNKKIIMEINSLGTNCILKTPKPEADKYTLEQRGGINYIVKMITKNIYQWIDDKIKIAPSTDLSHKELLCKGFLQELSNKINKFSNLNNPVQWGDGDKTLYDEFNNKLKAYMDSETNLEFVSSDKTLANLGADIKNKLMTIFPNTPSEPNRYIINNASPLQDKDGLAYALYDVSSGLSNNIICAGSTILDAAPKYWGGCDWGTGTGAKSKELGDVDISFKLGTLYYKLKVTYSKISNNLSSCPVVAPTATISVESNLPPKEGINAEIQKADLANTSLISGPGSFQNLTQELIDALKKYNATTNVGIKSWQWIDTQINDPNAEYSKDFYTMLVNLINKGTLKSVGDSLQTYNAVLENGGYTSGQYCKDTSVLGYNDGSAKRVICANDQPAAVLSMFLRLLLPEQYINKRSAAGYIGKRKVAMLAPKPLSGGAKKHKTKKYKNYKCKQNGKKTKRL